MRGTLRRPRSAALLAAALLALSVLATAAVANTVSGHQNPHLVVVAKVTPTQAHLGDTIVARATVTNTTKRTLTIDWDVTWETPTSGVGSASSGQRLKPGASVHQVFRRRVTAGSKGAYTLSVEAADRAGRSHATAHATAS